ncbi:CBU_1530 family Dot/Icm T4SS effector [Coxiella burnetii]|uniref:CBU_1530 family Dot/Icm T4SS effector n=1 Tax=Coxiella burnetii TaxID=777 RepID=UPI002230B5A9|nr:CBU_1530 family Dot/Icm T4SS effector [Coxiella burnetii]
MPLSKEEFQKQYSQQLQLRMYQCLQNKPESKSGEGEGEPRLTESQLIVLFLSLSAQKEGGSEREIDPDSELGKKINELGIYLQNNPNISLQREINQAHQLVTQLREKAYRAVIENNEGAGSAELSDDAHRAYAKDSERFKAQSVYYTTLEQQEAKSEEAHSLFVLWMIDPSCFCPNYYFYNGFYSPFDGIGLIGYGWAKLMEVQLQAISYIGAHTAQAMQGILHGVAHAASGCFQLDGDAGEALLFVIIGAVVAGIFAGGAVEFISAAEDAAAGGPGKVIAMGTTGAATGGACAALVALGLVSGPPGWLALGGVGITSLMVLAAAAIHGGLSKDSYELTEADKKRLKDRGIDNVIAEQTIQTLNNEKEKIGYTMLGTSDHTRKKVIKKQIWDIKSGKLTALNLGATVQWRNENDLIKGYLELAQQSYSLKGGTEKLVRDLIVKHEIQNALREGRNNILDHTAIITSTNDLMRNNNKSDIGKSLMNALFPQNTPKNIEIANLLQEGNAELLNAISRLVDYARKKKLSRHSRHDKAADSAINIAHRLIYILSEGNSIDINTILRYSDDAMNMKQKSWKQYMPESLRKARTIATLGVWNVNNVKVGRFGGHRTEGGILLAQVRKIAKVYNDKNFSTNPNVDFLRARLI